MLKFKYVLNAMVSLVFVGTLCGYPIVAALSILIDVENRMLSVPFRALILSSSLFLVMFFLRRPKKFSLCVSVWVFFWMMFLSRLFLEFFFNNEALIFDWGEMILYSIGVCFLPSLAFLFVKQDFYASIDLKTVVLACVTAMLLTALAIGKEFDFAILLAGRIETDTLNPIALGHLGLTAMLLSIWTLLHSKNTNVTRLFLVVSIVVSFVCVLASGSRGPIFSMLVVSLLYFINNMSVISLKKVLLMFVGVFVVVIILSVLYQSDIYMVKRLTSSFFSDASRDSLATNSFQAFEEHFFLGAWYPFSSYPHNLILESFMALGIFGGLSFFFVFISTSYFAYTLLKDANLGWVSILYFQYSTFVLVSSSLFYANQYWILSAAVIGLYLRKVRQGGSNYI